MSLAATRKARARNLGSLGVNVGAHFYGLGFEITGVHSE